MAVTMTGSVRSRAIPAGPPSKDRIDDASVSINDSTSALDVLTLSLVTGIAAAAPVHYSDLTTPVVVDASGNFQRFNVQQGPGPATTIQISDPPDLSGYTVGDHLWLCLFPIAVPIAGTAVSAAIDLGLLVA